MRLRRLCAIVVLGSTCIAACGRCGKDRRVTVDAPASTTPSLELSVFIGADGFRVTSLGANLAPGCASAGQGVAVPNKDGAYDFEGLTACALKVKVTPAGTSSAVTLAATPATKYQTVISTMDALRKSGGTDLFPDVTFGVARAEAATNSASSSIAPSPAVLPKPSTPPRPPAQRAPQPTVTTGASDESEGVAVLVSKSSIIVDDQVVVPVPSDAELGVDAKYKRTGRTDLYIVPLANALGTWRERDRQLRTATGKDPSSSEAILIADASMPYRLLVEVLFTLGQSEFGKFHLMVLQSAVK